MLLQYASDLHLEFPKNKQYLARNPIKPKAEILVLAGDIVPFNRIDEHYGFFKYLSDHFEQTYWVPGNHENYYSDAAKRSGTLCEPIAPNLHLVNWSNTDDLHILT